MNITVHHVLPGRLRLHYDMKEVSSRQAILAQTLIAVQNGITDVSINTNIGSFLIYFNPEIISQKVIENLFKALNEKYLEDKKMLEAVSQIPETESITKIFISALLDYWFKKLLPNPIRLLLLYKSIIPRVLEALSVFMKTGTLFSTQLLDATALLISTLTGNTNTASSINTLLQLGEDIEEVTKRTSFGNLAHTLLISNENVHVIENGEEKSIPANALKKGDLVIVREGSTIPCDGTVEKGEGMVNQAGITGESLPVEKKYESVAFAGTLLCEGELYIRTQSTGQNTKVQNIIQMIENSQNLKSSAQRRSELLAELFKKLSSKKDFPHEVGLFLGYPLEDVIGFEAYGASNFKYSGLWKVYGNKENAIASMNEYKNCTKQCINFLYEGLSVPLATGKYRKIV